jgi:hypothetical protein
VNRVTSLLALVLVAPPALAAAVAVTVKDIQGKALEDAAVWAMPRGEVPQRKRPAMVEQRNKTFVPIVSVIQTGTLVQFPNRDEIRHHIYSFSPAKVFEIKLYAGTPVDPILFDKPGEVVLGCNIHDHMYAYIYVVDSPWFAKTGKDGVATIEGLPAGEYDIHAQYFAQAAKPPAAPVKLREAEDAVADFTFTLRPMPPRPARK